MRAQRPSRCHEMLSAVITTKRLAPDQVKVTFALPDDGTPVAVIGTFNSWDAAWFEPNGFGETHGVLAV